MLILPSVRTVCAAALLTTTLAVQAAEIDDLFFAVRFNDVGTMQDLFRKGQDLNAKEPHRGESLLMMAIREKSFKVVEALINTPGIQLEAHANNGDTALMMASYLGQTEVAQKLIAKGAEVNQPGWTALHYAAASGKTELVALLLEHHAYIDTESPNKTTPLMMAVQFGKKTVVKLLLEEGADASLKNASGQTAQDFAKANRRDDILEVFAEFASQQKK